MYIEQQVARFPFFHLEAGGWYLDYFEGFVPKAEEALFSSLVDTAPVKPVPLEEPEEVQPQHELAKDKAAKPVKGKGKKTAYRTPCKCLFDTFLSMEETARKPLILHSQGSR